MDETQRLDDSFMDDRFELDGDQARKPLAKLRVFKNEHIPETELPLYLGENVLGRDPTSCSLLLDARSVSKRHAVISLSVFPGDRIHVSPVVEALVWDLGSMNGTRKGRFRLTPHVRYALTDGDSVVLADLPCQYVDTSEVLREGSAEPKRVVGGGELPVKGRGRSLKTWMGKESESTEGGWSNGIKNMSLKGNVKGGRTGNETVTPSVVRSMSLSLAQTPACPENLHVLELDSDSDDSTSASKGPTCSTFLSPMNSIVPESEDENSLFTPSSSVKDNSHQRMNKGGKGPATTNRKPQMVGYDSDSEFKEGETLRTKDSTTGLGEIANEQEGLPEGMAIDATLNGRAGPSENVGMGKSEAGPSPDVPQPFKPGSQVSSGGGSHTADNEEEERKDPTQRSDPRSLGNNDPNKSSVQDGPSASKPSFSMDSDTDVEGEEGSEQVLGTVSGTEATDRTCKSPRTSVVQPEEFHLDSDTDIEDNEDNAPMSPSTISPNVKPSSTAVIVPTEFHLDSDTDSKESEDCPGELVPPNPNPSTGLTEPILVKCPGLHLSSDTDDEAMDDDPFATSVRKTQGKRGTQQPAGGREVHPTIDPSSDSDVESSATQPFASTSKPELGSLLHQPASHSSPLRGAAQGSSSDSDTDVEQPESVRPGPGPRLPAVHLCLESDTDVEDGGEDGAADMVDGTDVLPVAAGGEMASGVVDQKCSTPMALLPEMDTQLFISMPDPFRRPLIPPVFPSRPSEGDQDDLKDDDFFIAETQSFVSEAPGGSSTGGPAAKQPCMLSSPPSSKSSSPTGFEEQPTMVYSFQLGLSDSSHERPGSSSRPAQLGLIAEDELRATQAYAAGTVTLSSGTVETDRDLEATQAYVMEAAAEADGAVQICTDDIMNIEEVGGEDHQRDFQANSHLSTADTQPVSVLEAVGVEELVPEDEDEEEGVKRSKLQRQRGSRRGNEEDNQPGRSTRSQRRAAVDQEPQKRDTRRISKAGGIRKGNGLRRKAVPDEDVESDMEEDESVQETSKETRRTRGRKSQKKGKDRVMMPRGTEGDEGDEVRGEETESSARVYGKRYKKKMKEQEEREERERLENERKEQEEREERERLDNERKEQEEREERERLEKERKEREEGEQRERLDKEKKEQEEREERERLEKEREEREERERLEKERKEREEREERERLEKEKKEREERERLEKERKEQERLEKERMEQEERKERERLEKERKEREEREERERLEKEKKEQERLEKERMEQEEREERERLEKERKEQEEREERERLEKEREERERLEKEREERERLEKERKEQEEREERERLEKEREEREERERLEKERKEQERLEKERMEQEEREEREMLEKERKERERLEKEMKEREEREERERLEKEKEEREEKEKLEEKRKEQERLEKEKKEREERERLEENRKERKEREERERLEKEQEKRKNIRKGKEKHGEQVKEDEEDLMKEKKIERKSARGKRKQEQVCKEREKDEEEEGEEEEQRSSSQVRGMRSRRSAAVSADEPRPCDNDTAMPELELRRGARANSRCSLVTSISSEKSISSIGTQERSHLRRGQKGNSQSGYTTLSMQGEGNLASSGGMGSCATSNSMGTSAERAMQTKNVQENTRSSTTKGADPEDKETHHSSAKASQVLDRDIPGPSMNDGGDCKGGKVSPSETATNEADQTIKDSEATGGKLLRSRSKSRSRSQKQDLKRVLDEGEQTNSFKVPMDRRKSQWGGERRGEELDGDETGEKGVEGEIPQPAVRKGMSGTGPAKKMKQEERGEAQGDQKEEDSTGSIRLKSRGRQTVAQRKKQSQVEMSEEQEPKDEALDPTSEQDGPGMDTEVPQTPVGRGSRKRVASSKSPLAVKTPRRTSVQAISPAVLSGSLQAPKVLFTCVTDEAGEAALSRLGGSLARGVADMTLLVTDRVRRTVKFLCAVARGIPVVTPCWLEKCSKNGAFLSPQAFLVKDVEQERKFNFCLEEALQTARAQPLLQGYEIHVTRAVKPDPAQMKDIISCSGARYLSRMPTVLKPQTVVISCVEDASLCGPALAASIPVLSAEFLLTGILQQKVDLVTHSLVGTGFGAPEYETPKGRRKR